MATTPAVLIAAAQAAAAQTTQYTSPIGTKTIIDKYTVTNPSGAPITYTVNIVPSGGGLGAGNVILARTIAAGETYIFPELVGQVLQPGDLISTLCSTGAVLVHRASGRQQTS